MAGEKEQAGRTTSAGATMEERQRMFLEALRRTGDVEAGLEAPVSRVDAAAMEAG